MPVIYVEYNANPKKKKHGDCVVRAICTAIEKSWEEVYIGLCNVGYTLKAMPNDKITYKEYLTKAGFVRTPIIVTKGSTRPTVLSFTQDHPNGVYIAEVANHIVAIMDGRFYDTWNCGSKCLYGYWTKRN